MVLITIVTGAYKPTYNWGASHCNIGQYYYGPSIYHYDDNHYMEKDGCQCEYLGRYVTS